VKPLPETERSLVLRSDFSDSVAWSEVCAEIQQPAGDFMAYVECVSDPEYDGLQPEQLVSASALGPYRGYVFVVDRTTLTHPEHPILVVDLHNEPGRTFRVIPAEMWAIENNLSLANMDFDEFADAVDEDGVFRGFPES